MDLLSPPRNRQRRRERLNKHAFSVTFDPTGAIGSGAKNHYLGGFDQRRSFISHVKAHFANCVGGSDGSDVSEAEGRASSIRAQGEAEAEIIFKKGEAEAKAMNVKAEAFQEYNQAAVLDKLISGMPKVVRALSEPLSKVDKVTIVSTGNGDAAGAYKLTGDITKIAAQVPALFEALSGMQMSELLGKVRVIGDKAAKPAIPPATTTL